MWYVHAAVSGTWPNLHADPGQPQSTSVKCRSVSRLDRLLWSENRKWLFVWSKEALCWKMNPELILLFSPPDHRRSPTCSTPHQYGWRWPWLFKGKEMRSKRIREMTVCRSVPLSFPKLYLPEAEGEVELGSGNGKLMRIVTIFGM